MIARVAASCLAALALLLPPTPFAAEPPADKGEAIYLRGVLASGAALVGSRSEGSPLKAAEAACVNCHRRSGFGGREGRTAVPPITGRYLFRQKASAGRDDRGIPYVEGMRGDREPYTDASLAHAIRDGVDSQGRPLSYLMPRYALKDADMAALIAHLKQLDHRKVPGVTDSTLHFATVITPDADPVKRRGMLDVMNQFFGERNVRQMVPAPPMQSSSKTAYARSMFMVHRRWELHVWELSGPESSWQAQLDKHLAAEPVFALLSGLGGHNWAPVHAFCERAAIPCLFPNVELPVDRARDFYSLYFSKGLLLEAELIADAIGRDSGGGAPKSVVQVYRSGDSGEAAAAALTEALKRRGLAASNQALALGAAAEGLADVLRQASNGEALVLWLRPDDLARLGEAPAGAGEVYASGLMGGLERAPLPASWRERTRLAYPFDLPDRRRVRVDFALGWFRARRIPVVAEQVQVDTYLACSLASETLNHMVDTFVRDYLIERTETLLEHRIVTGYYPRLTLAPGQRFASKGGYLVRFAGPEGLRLAADRDWTVP